jgi:NAD(P)-dependent dehydrogenase (short-subunit alcohol dehydrogenase family)
LDFRIVAKSSAKKSVRRRGEFSGRGVLVTGAGTGIGREIALEFARVGANVVFHYGHSAAGAESGVAAAKKLGVRAMAIQADLSDLSATQRLADESEEFLGHVDALVNNSGITFNKPFLKVEPAQFQKLYDVNVRAAFFLIQRLAAGMIKRGGGAVCNLTSIHGLQGVAEHSIYAGTKGAIIAYTRALGIELAHQGVRVNAIAPGWIAVENHARAVKNYTLANAKRTAATLIPSGRIGVPLDVAKLAVYLCSDAASFIVGQTIVIDGGTTALMSLLPDFRQQSTSRFGAQYV